jgi:hypothetical protein
VEQLFKWGKKRVPTFSGIKTDLERGLQAKRANTNLKIFLAGDMVNLNISNFLMLRHINLYYLHF